MRLGFTMTTPPLLPFKFEFDVEVFQKAGTTHERRIGGIVSTDGIDRQGEKLLQEGLDFGPFLSKGWFNDNHDSATEALIGYPDKAEMRSLTDGSTGWYVEGYLLKGHKRADAIWDLANALQKSDRRLGFSVEGGIVERDPNDSSTVRKAIVREVAITRCPVNTDTALNVLAKSLAAGNAVMGPSAPAAGDGFALRTESLDGDDEDEKKKRKGKGPRIKKSDAIKMMMAHDFPREIAERIVGLAQRQEAA